MTLVDRLQRPLRNLRVSVTDRCNLRCEYCMPEKEYVWLPREAILTFEETSALADVFASLGVDKIRLTGGEPLLRHDLPALVRMLSAKPAIRDLALTTNGVLLADLALELRRAGLHRITVSLDTLRPETFRELARLDALPQVLAGIERAAAAGFESVKLDTVVLRGVNDDEIIPMVDYGRSVGAEVRFIEYMDVGGATRWSRAQVVSRAEILERLTARYGSIRPLQEAGSAPAERFVLPDGSVFGIIASTTAPFCRSCDRSRLTADGMWYLCLYAMKGVDVRAPLRAGASADDLRRLISASWSGRTDRGAEERLALRERDPLLARGVLVRDPHLEMHTRGG